MAHHPQPATAMQISDLTTDHPDQIAQTAALLVAGFATWEPHPWPDQASALHEVSENLAPARISRIALDEHGTVLGWVGAQPYGYEAVWELHPLVVAPNWQGRGIGQELVADLEQQVRQRGGHTIVLGTDDTSNQTSLGGIDLYPDVLAHLTTIRNLRGHPYSFYQRVGFAIIGVIPDANGPGKPDILMARRVS